MSSDRVLRAKLRTAIADYMMSEGCSCCESPDHEQHKARIAELLNVPKYPDGDGYNFNKYRSSKEVF